MFTLIPLYNYDDKATCGNCQWRGPCEETLPIRAPGERLEAGEEVPAGECPRCCALVYKIPKTKDHPND